jgi:hypothetical protein
LAIDEQNAQKQASVLDLRKNRIVADCRRMGRECKKTWLLAILPGSIGSLLIDKEN